MGIWSQADIDALKTAVAAGVLEVLFSGPPERRVRYQDLGAMRALLASMIADVASQSGKVTYTTVATRKGFGIPYPGPSDPWTRY